MPNDFSNTRLWDDVYAEVLRIALATGYVTRNESESIAWNAAHEVLGDVERYGTIPNA